MKCYVLQEGMKEDFQLSDRLDEFKDVVLDVLRVLDRANGKLTSKSVSERLGLKDDLILLQKKLIELERIAPSTKFGVGYYIKEF